MNSWAVHWDEWGLPVEMWNHFNSIDHDSLIPQIRSNQNHTAHIQPQGGSFTKSQSRAILTAGLVCACISLVASLVALRWFLLMKKCFRHRLILYLIGSDAFKAVWYFVFPLVSFIHGPVKTSSSFCQASGFLLAFSVEASDFAILVIAFHTILCVFRPTHRSGEGGVYPYRHWIYPFWLGLPLISASLAFVNQHHAYVTAGTLCYLPKRPFWYRLALSWVPRYLIITTILVMYAAIYIYVHIKFRGFSNLGGDDTTHDSSSPSTRLSSFASPHQLDGPTPTNDQQSPNPNPVRPSAFRMSSFNSIMAPAPKPQPIHPWDAVQFITTKNLRDTSTKSIAKVNTADFADKLVDVQLTEIHGPPRQLSVQYEMDETTPHQSRKPSMVPTLRTDYTGETVSAPPSSNQIPRRVPGGTTDQLRATRVAIRRQMNFLFLYPAIYVLMWVFPLVNHILNYSNHWVQHPSFWLSIVVTCSLGLQAGVDCVVFSWREQPWKRVKCKARIPFSRSHRSREVLNSEPAKEEPSEPFPKLEVASKPQNQSNRTSHWWEVEGRRRKDSVMLGTDALTIYTSRREQGASRDGSSHEQTRL